MLVLSCWDSHTGIFVVFVDRSGTRVASVAPHLLAAFQENTYALARKLREKNERLNEGATVCSVLLLEQLVQAAATMGSRADADIKQALIRDYGASIDQVGVFYSDDGHAGVPRADWVGAVGGRGGGGTRMHGRGMYGRGPGRGSPHVQGL